MGEAIMVVTSCSVTKHILVCTYDGHFIILRVREDLSCFDVIHDVTRYREDNQYRYIRHASLREHTILFCAELGKDSNKLVVI